MQESCLRKWICQLTQGKICQLTQGKIAKRVEAEHFCFLREGQGPSFEHLQVKL